MSKFSVIVFLLLVYLNVNYCHYYAVSTSYGKKERFHNGVHINTLQSPISLFLSYFRNVTKVILTRVYNMDRPGYEFEELNTTTKRNNIYSPVFEPSVKNFDKSALKLNLNYSTKVLLQINKYKINFTILDNTF